MRSVEANVGGKKVILSVAETRDQKSQGFMFRESIGEDEGIIFVNEGDDISNGFWMKNVSVPLSIAFLNENFEIFEVMDLVPGDLVSKKPRSPFSYAIEMRRGWFDENCTTTRCEIPLR